MAKITYNNKSNIITNPEVPAEAKVRDIDMNEIKQVVNENYDEMVADSGWIDAELSNDFEIYSSSSVCKYRKKGNIVEVTGQVKTTRSLQSGIIFTLPDGFRPDYEIFLVQQGSGVNRWLCLIRPNGEIVAQRYGTTSQIDITTSQWLPFSLSFLVN